MRSRTTLESLRGIFLDLYATARDQGEHEIAYHALMAAEHAAQRLGDIPALQAIEQRAREHAGWLDAHDPQHRLSSFSASTRGHESLFEQLAQTAAAARARIHAERVREKTKGARLAPLGTRL